MLKNEIRILGFDDAAFLPRSKDLVPVIGLIYRGGKFPDGALRTDVKVDGKDASEKIIKLINSSRHKQQLRVIMFDGITLAGFNVVDIKKIYEKTGLPVIVINRKLPNLERVRKALMRFDDFEQRWRYIQNAGKLKVCEVRGGKVYYQAIGLSDEETEEIINLSSTRSYIPEPLRVAHLIATAVVRGESYGHA
ncbi:MAG: DUF99 family protein [Candidatus Aenigmarchaeota archaeon]|nr:DUF99 family protein [Candidatus Aenigmarchaeota archaeon]